MNKINEPTHRSVKWVPNSGSAGEFAGGVEFDYFALAMHSICRGSSLRATPVLWPWLFATRHLNFPAAVRVYCHDQLDPELTPPVREFGSAHPCIMIDDFMSRRGPHRSVSGLAVPGRSECPRRFVSCPAKLVENVRAHHHQRRSSSEQCCAQWSAIEANLIQ